VRAPTERALRHDAGVKASNQPSCIEPVFL
jgi:hypothetical protein